MDIIIHSVALVEEGQLSILRHLFVPYFHNVWSFILSIHCLFEVVIERTVFQPVKLCVEIKYALNNSKCYTSLTIAD